jgi:hypothetical protein
MVVNRSPILRFILTVLVIAMPVAVFAAPVGKAIGGGTSIEWQLSVSGHERIVLTVSAPDGEVYSKEFKAGTPVEFSAKDLPALVDGEYTYQLTVVPRISAGLREQLAAARNSGDEAGARAIMKKAGLEPITQTGGFAVANGMVVATDREENQRPGGAMSNAAREPGTAKEPSSASATPRPGAPVVNDQVIPDDLIVQGSECVGLDCVNNESFGFDTIRLKENNTRIKFDDTSTSTGFPANDWQLTANDSASGGSSKFSIEDITGSKVPFTVTAGASTNSIFVDSTGRVGFRTSTPVLDLHVATSNTPAIRLEQNNSGGFTAQTWDIAGNEANFFVRDVTGGSRLPFRIRPGAPTSSIDISASGKIGVNTASPGEALHVFGSDDANTFIQIENTSTGTSALGGFRAKNNAGALGQLISHGSGRTTTRYGVSVGNRQELLSSGGDGLLIGTLEADDVIIGTNNVNRLQINGSTGAVTVSGNFTVTGTKNFGVPDPADATKAIYFSALEGPEAGTYYRGTAKTVNGEVTITMPGPFARVTEKERMTVQLTPIGAPGQLYIASRSPEKIVVKTDGSSDVEFDFLVQGVRKGYLDFEVERANTLPK